LERNVEKGKIARAKPTPYQNENAGNENQKSFFKAIESFFKTK